MEIPKEHGRILDMLDTKLNLEEIQQVLGLILDHINAERTATSEELDALRTLVPATVKELKDFNNEKWGKIMEQVRTLHDGRDGIDGLNGKDADEQAIIQIILSHIKQPENGKDGLPGKDGSPDTPDEVVQRVNESSLLIAKERVEGLVDYIRMAAINAAGAMPITTSFFNGLRAKNLNIVAGSNITLTQKQQGDAVNVTVSSTAGGSGTVTSVASADGSVTVTNPTTTPDLAVVSAPKLTTARTIDGVSFDGSANITVIAPATHAATSKATPVDADEVPLTDSAASFVLKRLTWANVKATLKTYFDTLYGAGTVTAVSVASANGFAGSSSGGATPALTLSTSINAPVLAGNGTAIAAATTSGTGSTVILQGSPTLTTAVLGSSTATTQTPADNSTKLATTAYVDNAILGQRSKEAVKYASTAALPSIVYANGSSGVGATLTGVALGAISLDSSSPSVADRVLIKNQVAPEQNGIYVVTAAGSGAAVFVLTRAIDFDQASDIQTGDTMFVTAGSTLANTTWTYNGIDSPTMGTTALTFVQAAGPGSYTAGNGIAITGVSIAIDTSVTVDKTTVQTLTNKTLTSPVLTTPALGTPASGVMTNVTGVPAAAILAGSFGAGAYVISTSLQAATIELGAATDTTLSRVSAGLIAVEGSNIGTMAAAQVWTGQNKFNNIVDVNNAITASANAATVPVTFRLNTVTNNSAATLTITMTTASAVDGQMTVVRILDFSAAAQTVTWVNTENSTITAPVTSNGSTTLFLTVGFIYNSGTSKWRCIASA